MFDLLNSQIGKFSQIHRLKKYTCHLGSRLLIKMDMFVNQSEQGSHFGELLKP